VAWEKNRSVSSSRGKEILLQYRRYADDPHTEAMMLFRTRGREVMRVALAGLDCFSLNHSKVIVHICALVHVSKVACGQRKDTSVVNLNYFELVVAAQNLAIK
jgi:hypothetical protein